MRSHIHNHVPSASLLRFLRAQSEGACFFSSNPRQGYSLDHAPHVPASSLGYNYPSRSCRRPLSTSLQRRATVGAGFQNPKFLGSRLATSNSSSNDSHPKRATLSSKTPATQNRSQSSRRLFTSARKWPFKLWSSKRDGKPLQPDDLPHLSEDGRELDVFSLGRSVSVKAASEPRLRCTELDENGNVVLVNGEFKKSELIAKVGQDIFPRRHFERVNTDLHIVWTASSRSSKNRLEYASAYPCSSFSYPHQPPPSSSSHKVK